LVDFNGYLSMAYLRHHSKSAGVARANAEIKKRAVFSRAP